MLKQWLTWKNQPTQSKPVPLTTKFFHHFPILYGHTQKKTPVLTFSQLSIHFFISCQYFLFFMVSYSTWLNHSESTAIFSGNFNYVFLSTFSILSTYPNQCRSSSSHYEQILDCNFFWVKKRAVKWDWDVGNHVLDYMTIVITSTFIYTYRCSTHTVMQDVEKYIYVLPYLLTLCMHLFVGTSSCG